MYEAFIPLVATLMLAFTMSRWATDELAREGRLSKGAAAGVTATVVLHALLVIMCSAGAVGAVDIPRAVAFSVGLPLAGAGAALAVAAFAELGGWARTFLVDPGARPGGAVHRRFAHPLHLGWAAFLLGVALAGRSVLAMVLAVAAALWLWRLARSEGMRSGRFVAQA